MTQPRTPYSPPELPTSTLFFTTSGAIVMVSPRLMLPSLVRQISFPVFASTAIVLLSSVLKKMRPPENAAPRLTTSQHATPCAAGSGLGSYFHFIGAPPFVRARAYRIFGYGETRYIVPSTINGAASCPLFTPVEKVKATCRFFTFSVLISV